jgi:hypothetical protein
LRRDNNDRTYGPAGKLENMEVFVWIVYGIKLIVFKNLDSNEFLQFNFVMIVQRDTAPPTKYTARSRWVVTYFFVLINL